MTTQIAGEPSRGRGVAGEGAGGRAKKDIKKNPKEEEEEGEGEKRLEELKKTNDAKWSGGLPTSY